MEKFFEQKPDSLEERRRQEEELAADIAAYQADREIRDNVQDRNIAFQFDRMIYGKSTAQKLNAVETFNDLKNDLMNDPANSDLAHLKERVIEPLTSLKVYQADRSLRERTRELFDKRYTHFLMPGYVQYDFRHHESKVINPSGISFGLQKLALKKAGLLKDSDQIALYAAGQEEELPKDPTRKSLIISAGTDGHLKSPTMALFDVLRRTGHYNRLSVDEQKELTAAFTFAEIVEKGEWLEGAMRNFYDENDITLFKINRLLPTETLTALLKDMTADVPFDPRKFAESKREMRRQLFIRAAAKLSPEMIAKYHLDEKSNNKKSIIERQKESIINARKYMEEEKNATAKSNLGRIIYVKSEEGGKVDKLPGGLPALAAEAPKKKGKPAWPLSSYVEVLNTHFLGFVPKSRVNGLVDVLNQETIRSGLHLQITPIGNWVKLFIPFPGAVAENVVNAFERHVFQPKEQLASDRRIKKSRR
jgi:hypothetical protein